MNKENEQSKDKMKTRKVRVRKKTPLAVRQKISDSLKKYWSEVIYTDEEGNIINREKKE